MADSVDAQGALAGRVARLSSSQAARALSDVNATPVKPEFNKATGQYVYESAPVPLKQLFASPVAQTGPSATGPKHERLIASGWGDAHPDVFDPRVAEVSTHTGLDYVAPVGESVLAAASGKVTFVGYQAKDGSLVALDALTSNDAKEEIYDATGAVVASTKTNGVGLAGVLVTVEHDADFQGYKTGYYHLSTTSVKLNDTVTSGQKIGAVGGTGGPAGWIHASTFLHFQIEYVSGQLRMVVQPTALVPNYWPTHADSTNASTALDIAMPLVASVLGQAMASRVANVLSGFNRSTTIQNKGVAEVQQDKSNYAQHVAHVVNVQRTALYTATASAKDTPPKVTSPMTFDFDKGVWLVNGVENGVV